MHYLLIALFWFSRVNLEAKTSNNETRKITFMQSNAHKEGKMALIVLQSHFTLHNKTYLKQNNSFKTTI